MPTGYLIVTIPQGRENAPRYWSKEGHMGNVEYHPAMSRDAALSYIKESWGEGEVPLSRTFTNHEGKIINVTIDLQPIEAKFVK